MMQRTLEGRYQIGHLLGKGAQGEIYKLKDLEFPDRPLVIKIFPKTGQNNLHFERCLNAFRYASGFRHPGLLRIYHANILYPENIPYYIAEFFNASALSYRNAARLTESDHHVVFSQITCALDYLHRAGLLHLDLKPSNILLSNDAPFTLKLIDYGLIHRKLKRLDSPVGTLHYMSPRLIRGKKPRVIDDLYSFGALMFRWLIGQLPYDNLSPEDFIGRIQLGNHPFHRASFKACGSLAPLIRGLLFYEFESTQDLQGNFTPDRRPSHALYFPQHQPQKKRLSHLSSQLEGLFKKNTGPAPTLLITGPQGAGKSQLAHAITRDFCQKHPTPTFYYNGLPQNNLIALVRSFYESQLGIRAFSGLDPDKTVKSLLSSESKLRFFDEIFSGMEQVIKNHQAFLLILENIPSNDGLFLEFLVYLNEQIKAKSLAVGLIIAIETPEESPDNQPESLYLSRIHRDFATEYVHLKSWEENQVKNYLDEIFQKTTPSHLLDDLKKNALKTPGNIAAFLERSALTGALTQNESHWVYANDGNCQDPSNQTSLFLVKILPYLPRPITASQINLLSQHVESVQNALVDLVRMGFLAKEEERYFWNHRNTERNDSLTDLERLALLNCAKKDPIFLLPLCQLQPNIKHTQALLNFLRTFEGSDQYLPLDLVIENCLMALAADSGLRSPLLFHQGRIQSFQGQWQQATRSLQSVIKDCTNPTDEIRFYATVELANVYSKMKEANKSIHLLEESSNLDFPGDQKTFLLALLSLQKAIHQGGQAVPLPGFESAFERIQHPGLKGRLAMRYAQVLYWAQKLKPASQWINQAILFLTQAQQDFRLARAKRLQAKILRQENKITEAIQINESSLRQFKDAFFPKEEIETLVSLFYLKRRQNKYHQLDSYLARIQEILPLMEDTEMELLNYELQAMRWEWDKPLKALRLYRKKERLARLYQSPKHLYIAIVNQMHLEYELGNLQKSKKCWQKATKIFSEYGQNFPPRFSNSIKQITAWKSRFEREISHDSKFISPSPQTQDFTGWV